MPLFLTNHALIVSESNMNPNSDITSSIDLEFILQPFITSSHYEVSQSLSAGTPSINYDQIANELTGSSPSRQALQLQKAETYLAISYAAVPLGLRWSDQGGIVRSTGFQESLNQLEGIRQTKLLENHFRRRAKQIIRQQLWLAQSSSFAVSTGSEFPSDWISVGWRAI